MKDEILHSNWALKTGFLAYRQSQFVPAENIHILAGTENKHNSSDQMTPGIINSWGRKQFKKFRRT